MRIGLVTGEYPPMQGGVGDFTCELSAALAELGHEVHVITRTGCGPSTTSLWGSEVESAASRAACLRPPTRCPTVHPIVPNWGWRFYRWVTSLTRQLHLDVLNIQYQAAAYDMHPAINLFPLLAFRGYRWRARLNSLPLLRRGKLKAEEELVRCPIVVTFHDLKVPYLFPKAGPLRDGVVTLLARHSDAAIATNRVDNLTLVARGVVHVERIPIGSNITPILPDDYDRVEWRAKLDVGSDNCLLGFFGFFNARKGIETLIRALAAMDHSYHLLFIGGTIGSSDATNRAYAEHIRTLIAELNLTERVHYTGYVPATEVSAAFSAVDLCVLPYAGGISFHHGTLMAAMAHGQPIISTWPSIELPELIHGENVWLVSPDDADALGAAVTTLAADPARRRRLAEGAGELSTRFSWEHIAVRTADLFENVKRAT